ncbi:ketosteroid isomerase-related protein [Halomonas sp. H5]|uniref:ketosteroid isomerase-related protein n=1 Tax=Halomonas sp. H5 TaxID=3423910 RepID=UPI003D369D3C
MHPQDVIQAYYDAFNAGDMAAFLDLLTDDVAHDINQGERQVGKAAFADFMAHMNRCYRERLEELVILIHPAGDRAAAEFVVHGEYLTTDEGLPEANGQHYVLPAGAFFTLRDGKVARISNYYNLNDWLAQVGADGISA